MKDGILGSALLTKQLLLHLIITEFGYERKVLLLGDAQSWKKGPDVDMKALRSVGRHQTAFLMTCRSLSQGWDSAKKNKLMLGIVFKT